MYDKVVWHNHRFEFDPHIFFSSECKFVHYISLDFVIIFCLDFYSIRGSTGISCHFTADNIPVKVQSVIYVPFWAPLLSDRAYRHSITLDLVIFFFFLTWELLALLGLHLYMDSWPLEFHVPENHCGIPPA